MIRLIVTGRRGAARHDKGLNTMAKKTYTIDAGTLTKFANAGFAGEKQFEKEVALIKSAAVKGVLPPEYSLAFRAGVVCAKAELANTKANRALVTTTEGRKKYSSFWSLAGNRLKLRVAEAGITNGNKAGRKRGTKVTPPASTTQDGPTLQESAANASMPKTATPAVPTLVNAGEVMAYLESKVAQMRAAQKKNAKHFTLKQKAALDAFAEAIKGE